MRTAKSISILCVLILFTFPLVSRCSAVALPVAGANSASGQQNDPQFGGQREQKDRFEIEREKEMARARQQERYKQLKRDSEQLLELSTELKQYIDKANADILSVQVIKKAEQIEKLAKQVKNRMRGQ